MWLTNSVRTGGYCRARQRLPLEMVSALARETGRLLSQKARAPWLWRGGAVKLVDGTGLSMPDTPENQARYPQPTSQAPGVAADRKLTHLRPLCRLKTDPGVLLALPKFWAGDKQGDHHGNVGKNSTDVFARQGVAA